MTLAVVVEQVDIAQMLQAPLQAVALVLKHQ
jgi:hypothetical protein